MNVRAKQRQHSEHDQLLGLEPVAVEPCISRDYFELECERIFRRAWLNVGHVTQLAGENSYFVHDIPNIGASVIVNLRQPRRYPRVSQRLRAPRQSAGTHASGGGGCASSATTTDGPTASPGGS